MATGWLVGLALLALPGIQGALGHERTAPWLDEAALDDGLYVALRHPSVIRRDAPFPMSVSIMNLAGEGSVSVEAMRYRVPGAAEVVVNAGGHVLPSKRAPYRRYVQVREALNAAASGGDRATARKRFAESRRLLAQLRAGDFSHRWRVAAGAVPPAGETLDLAVEIDLLEAGGRRTLRRTLRLAVERPLPRGPDGAWFAGDQHLHTAFSADAFLFEETTDTVWEYADTARAVGLDWITVTEHSNVDFLVWFTPELFWVNELLASIYRVTQDYLVLAGEEMGAGALGPFGEPAHLLAYPWNVDSTGFLENPCLVLGVLDCEPEQVIVDRVNARGGVSFIAHPMEASLFGSAAWDFDAGIVGWAGVEIFNASTADEDNALAVDKWHELLDEIGAPVAGKLPFRPEFPNRFPVGIGNSDAHRPGRIGNAFSYVHLPGITPGTRLPRAAVLDAVVNGRLVASNGPLVFAEIAGAGTGEVAAVARDRNTIEVTLATTPEFGAVGDYTLTVLVNGIARAVLPPSGSTEFEITVSFEDLLAPPDTFVTVRAERTVCGGCPRGAQGYGANANPIWVEFVE